MKSHSSVVIILFLTLILGGVVYAASDPAFFRSGIGGRAFYAPQAGNDVRIDEDSSVRSDPFPQAPGDVGCRDVYDQRRVNDILVPVNSQSEWNNFVYNVSGSVAYLAPCPAPAVPGCTDPTARNYNPSATADDGSCTFSQCFDMSIDAFDNALNGGDAIGVCLRGISDPDYRTTVSEGPWFRREDWTGLIGVCDGYATASYVGKITDVGPYYPCGPSYGCTDPAAKNYKPAATINDSSCTY